MIFQTDRLTVRQYDTGDAPFVLDMYSRRDVLRFLGGSPRPMQSLAEASATIERWRSIGDRGPGLGCWAVEVKPGRLVGTVLLVRAPLSSSERPAPLSDDLEIGWHLHPDHWGNGYASEMAAGALRMAFDGGAAEVLALVARDNERSKRVAKRIGMTYRGLTDRYYSVEAELYLAWRGQAGQ